MAPLLISILPHPIQLMGHEVQYHEYVAKGVRAIGWDFLALYPTDSPAAVADPAWRKVLHRDDQRSVLALWRRGNVFAPLRIVRRLQRSLERALQAVVQAAQPDRVVFFLESFDLLSLVGVVLALRTTARANPRLSGAIMVLHRTSPRAKAPHHRLCRFVQRWVRRLGRLPLVLATDSRLLQESLHAFYAAPVQLLPVPHGDFSDVVPFKQHPFVVPADRPPVLWWPGNPRPEKGLDCILQLARTANPLNEPCRLQLAESLRTAGPFANPGLEWVSTQLTTPQFYATLVAADIVLLPYSTPHYQESTSGLFVEAIVAGVVPIVTPDTWMASELRAHDLAELICPATLAGLREGLRSARAETVQQKLRRMQRQYRTYHSAATFGVQMRAYTAEAGDAPAQQVSEEGV